MGEGLKTPRRRKNSDKGDGKSGGGAPDRKTERRPKKGREGRERSRAARSDAFLIHGRRPVREFLKSDLPRDGIEVIFVSESMSDRDLLEALPRPLLHGLARREMDDHFPELNHQGVIIKFHPGRTPFDGIDEDWSSFVKSRPGFLLALDEIQDPQNLGSILRSAEALGVCGVFLTGRGSDISPAAVRVSAGAAFHIPAFKVANPNRLLDAGRQAGYFIASAAGLPGGGGSQGASVSGTSVSGASLSLDITQRSRLPEAREILLFIGNEGAGVRPLVRKKSDFLISVPMRGKTDSLNAGVAAGILIDRLINHAQP